MAWIKITAAFLGRVLERFAWKPLVRWSYGQDIPAASAWHTVKTFLIWQRVFRINSGIPWPVHPTSRVANWQKIRISGRGMPGSSPGCYIQAGNGIFLGDNVLIGPGAGIISANHSRKSTAGWDRTRPVTIGNDVWIGMNAVILPGVSIDDQAIIGAGSVVHDDIPSHSVAAGNPCRVVRSRVENEACPGIQQD
jgi:hypothetical protein